MKKNYLLGMALIASLSFYSCDKEVVYVQDGNGVESVADGAQIITLQVENGGDGLALPFTRGEDVRCIVPRLNRLLKM